MFMLTGKAMAAFAVVAILAIGGSIGVNNAWQRSALTRRAEILTGGDVERGRREFSHIGCGGCHTVGGVPHADGLVGPPLDGIAERAFIAGKLTNTPGNLDRWISAPQSVVPGNAMPDLPMTAQDSRDLAAFLYTRV